MAWTTPGTAVSGATATAAFWNANVRDNLNAGFPDAVSGVAWSPTLEATSSNPVVDSVTGRQFQVGALMFLWARFVVRTGGSGTYFVQLPVAASGVSGADASGQPIGSAILFDTSTPANRQQAAVFLDGSGDVRFLAEGQFVTDSTPFNWGGSPNDLLGFHVVYPVA